MPRHLPQLRFPQLSAQELPLAPMFRPGGTDLDLILETLPRIIKEQKECIALLRIIGERKECKTLLRRIEELRELKTLLRRIGEQKEFQTLLRALLRVLGEMMKGRIPLMSAGDLGSSLGMRQKILNQELTLQTCPRWVIW